MDKLEIFRPDMVKALRERTGWTQQELADSLDNVGKRSIVNWESGKVKKMSASKRAQFLELKRRLDEEGL